MEGDAGGAVERACENELLAGQGPRNGGLASAGRRRCGRQGTWNRTVRRESLVPGGFVLYNEINRKLGDNEYEPCLAADKERLAKKYINSQTIA